MRKSWVIPNPNARKPSILQLGTILLLVLCALLLQRFVAQVLSANDLSQAEFIEELRIQGVEPETMGMAVAPLTIHGVPVRLRGGPLVQPADISVYEDFSNAVTIDNNVITSQPSSERSFWVSRDGTAADASIKVINVSEWSVPLHVFQRGQLIVLYPGSDEAVLDLLSGVMGRPVAGP